MTIRKADIDENTKRILNNEDVKPKTESKEEVDKLSLELKEIKDLILNNQNKFEEDKKIKKPKLPGGKLSLTDLKKNYVTVQIINDNREVKFIKLPIENGCVVIDGVPKMSMTEFMLTHKGKPLIILPSWTLKPFSPVDSYNQTIQDKVTLAGRKLIIEQMRKEAIVGKKMTFGWWAWALLGLAIIGIIYYLTKGGGKLW